MLDHRTPPFGTLRSVVPIVQSQKRGPWRLTLISLELWDNCWATNFELSGDPLSADQADLSPFLTFDAVEDGGQRYSSALGGAFGGGRLNGGQEIRMLVRFAPPIDPDSVSVRLEGHLRLLHPGQGPIDHDPPAWEDPEPWVFAIAHPEVAQDAEATQPATSLHRDPPSPNPRADPFLGDLVRVVPVVREQTVEGWTVTIAALEIRAGGIVLGYRLLGPPPEQDRWVLPSPMMTVTDTHGREFLSLKGGSNGVRDTHGRHLRGTYHALVPPGVRDVHIRVDEIQIETVEVAPNAPGTARPVPAERIPFGWDLTIPLR